MFEVTPKNHLNYLIGSNLIDVWDRIVFVSAIFKAMLITSSHQETEIDVLVFGVVIPKIRRFGLTVS